MESNNLLNRIELELLEDRDSIFLFCMSNANQGTWNTVNIQ